MEIEDFIQAIVAEPDVDDHRLVFADFLEEQSDPRAELIRLQFEMRDVSKMDPRWATLRRRELKLLKEHGGFGEKPKIGRILSWHGGFVDKIETTLAQLVSKNKELLACTTVRGVQVKATSKRFRKLFDSPYLNRLQKLRFKNNDLSEDELCEFLSLDGLANLKELSIHGSDYGEAVAETIGKMPHFKSLESLRLSDGGGDIRSVQSIVQSEHIDGLRSLSLYGVSDESVIAIAGSDKFAKLERLELAGFSITNDAVVTLHNSVFRESLTELVFLTGDFLHREWHSKRNRDSRFSNPFPNLKSLQVGWGFGDETLISIVESYRNLEKLEFGYNQVTDRGAETLANSELLASLKRLVFTENLITARGAEALRESKYWNGKTKLHLSSRKISSEQLLAIGALREKYGKTFGNLGWWV